MTSRERVMTSVRGGEPDVVPTLLWRTPGKGDVYVACGDVPEGAMGLHEQLNPFGLAVGAGLDLNGLAESEPAEFESQLNRLSRLCIQRIETALDRGSDGVFYVLVGAEGKYSTPMQYGGLYLEADREILRSFSDAQLNVVFGVGNENLFIDVLTDLPANALAWDFLGSGFDSGYVKALWPGALCSGDPGSEISLSMSVGAVDEAIQEVVHFV